MENKRTTLVGDLVLLAEQKAFGASVKWLNDQVTGGSVQLTFSDELGGCVDRRETALSGAVVSA